MLLECLLRHVVGGLIELVVHALAQSLVVDLVVVLALHVGAQLLGKLGLELAHRLDGGHGSFQSAEQILLAHLVHLALYHHNVLSRSTNHDVHVGVLHLLEGGVDDILSVNACYAHLGDRTLEGNI